MYSKDICVYIESNSVNVTKGIKFEDEKYLVVTNEVLYDINSQEIQLNEVVNYYKNIEISNIVSNNFTLIVIDKVSNKITCIQDTIGDTIPIYYYKNEDKVIISNRLIEILNNVKLKPILNNNCINTFMNKGYIPNKNTLIKDVYKLIPKYNLEISLKSKKIKYIKKKIKYKNSKCKKNNKIYINKFENIINNVTSKKGVYMTLSNGYDSNFIYSFLDKKKVVNAITIGGTIGSNEIKKVKENTKADINTKLLTTVVDNLLLDELPKIVYYLEGAMYERGIFLQYKLFDLLKDKDLSNAVMLSGEGADEIFSYTYHNKFGDFMEKLKHIVKIILRYKTKESIISYNPKGEFNCIYNCLSYVISKKNGIFMNEANIYCVHPFIYKPIIDIGRETRIVNKFRKQYQIDACGTKLNKNVLKNIKKIGGTTDSIALFKNCKYLETLEKVALNSKFNVLTISNNNQNDYFDYLTKVTYLELFNYMFIENYNCINDIKEKSLYDIIKQL